MELINNVYKDLKKWKEERGSWSTIELSKSKIFNRLEVFTEELKKFDGLKVKISYTSTADYFTSNGEKKGKVKIVGDEIRFYEGRKTAKYYRLNSGLYEGFFATLILLKIETI